MTNLNYRNENESTRVYKEILERMKKLLNFTHLSKSLDDCSVINNKQKIKKCSKKKDLNATPKNATKSYKNNLSLPFKKKVSEEIKNKFKTDENKSNIPLNEDILPFNASFMSLALTGKELQDIEVKVNKINHDRSRTIQEKYKILRSVFFKEQISSLEFDNTNTCFSPICLTRNLNLNDNDLLSTSSNDSNLDADFKSHPNVFGQNTFTVMQVNNSSKKRNSSIVSNCDDKECKSVSVNTKRMKYKQINNEEPEVYVKTSDEYPYDPSASSLPFEVLEYDILEKEIVITEDTKEGLSKLEKQIDRSIKSSKNKISDKLDNKKQKRNKYPYEPSLTSLPLKTIEPKPLIAPIVPPKRRRNSENENLLKEEQRATIEPKEIKNTDKILIPAVIKEEKQEYDTITNKGNETLIPTTIKNEEEDDDHKWHKRRVFKQKESIEHSESKDSNPSINSKESDDLDKTLTPEVTEEEPENYDYKRRDSEQKKNTKHRKSKDISETLIINNDKKDSTQRNSIQSKGNEDIDKTIPITEEKENKDGDNKPRQSIQKGSFTSEENKDLNETVIIRKEIEDDDDKPRNSKRRGSVTYKENKDMDETMKTDNNQRDSKRKSSIKSNKNRDSVISKKEKDDDIVIDHIRRDSEQSGSNKIKDSRDIDKTSTSVIMSTEKDDDETSEIDNKPENYDYKRRDSEQKKNTKHRKSKDISETIMINNDKKDSTQRNSIQSKGTEDIDKTIPITEEKENKDGDNKPRQSIQKGSSTSKENNDLNESVIIKNENEDYDDKPRDSKQRGSITYKGNKDMDETMKTDNNQRDSKRKSSIKSNKNRDSVISKKEKDDDIVIDHIRRDSEQRGSNKIKDSRDIDKTSTSVIMSTEKDDDETTEIDNKQIKSSVKLIKTERNNNVVPTEQNQKSSTSSKQNGKLVWALALVQLEDDEAKIVKILHTTSNEPGHYLFKEPNELFLFGSNASNNHKKSKK